MVRLLRCVFIENSEGILLINEGHETPCNGF
jgi:hypothetical protein